MAGLALTAGTRVQAAPWAQAAPQVRLEPAATDPLLPGIHAVSETQVQLCLEAPGKSTVHVVGDFNDWTPSPQNQMTHEGDKFRITLDGLTPGKEYIFQYWIDDGIKIGDPYADKIVDFGPDKEIAAQGVYPGLISYTRESDGPASVFRAGLPVVTASAPAFKKPDPENLIIYEVLVRDFTPSHSFKEMRDSLAYFERLGVNAIELMPVMEFEGNSSWGYNSSYMFAVDKYYGPADELKHLIQAAHARGIAVILDIVLNHAMGQSPLIRMYLDPASKKVTENNPYANVVPKHDYNVGYDLNYGSPYTLAYYKQVLQHWLRDYAVDGFRIDLSKGLTQKNTLGDVAAWGHLDTSRVRILGELAAAARMADPNAYLILEHFADNEEEKLLSGRGFLLWGNSSYDHGYAEEGRTETDFAWANAGNRGWNENHLVTYMESHDEERLVARAMMNGKSSGGYDIRKLPTALERAKMAALFLFGIPGAKQMWEWGEWGDDRPRGTTAAERMGEKPLPEGFRNDPDRRKLWKTYAALIHFRRRFEIAFKDGTFTWTPGGVVRNWKLAHAGLNAFAVGNFGVNADKTTLNLTGTWYDFFSREKFSLSGSAEIPLQPGEFHLFTDQPVFAPEADLNPFPVPNSLNPQVVGLAARPAPKTNRMNGPVAGPGIRMIHKTGLFPEVADGAGRFQDLRGRKLIPKP